MPVSLKSISTLLREYARFNTWANTQITEWLSAKAEALLTQETPSSFSTLRDTLLHIWGAQEIWLSRLQGVSPAQFLSETFAGNNRTLIEGLLENSRAFETFVAGQPDEFFERSTAYKHTTGTPYDQQNAEILLHCLQHSTFHRGQIVTMGRSLGMTDPPKTDYIAYVRLRDLGK